MKVELINYMGSDLTVVDAARVSFNKRSEWIEDIDGDKFLSSKDEKLIKYLADHNHWSPFSHAQLQFRIKAPIFVARQLVKHQVGLAWNEVSRRYVDDEPEFYFPEKWRGKPVNKKQGSSEEFVEKLNLIDDYEGKIECSISVNDAVKNCIQHLKTLYNTMITQGVAPEQARMVLPQNMYTEWYWTGSLYAFARVCNLRLKPDAQEETRYIANEIFYFMEEKFPSSTQCLVKG